MPGELPGVVSWEENDALLRLEFLGVWVLGIFRKYYDDELVMFGQNRTTGFGTFGSGTNTSGQSGGLFGGSNNSNTGGAGGGAFGASGTSGGGGGLFGQSNANTSGGGLFGQSNTNNSTSGGGLFGNSGSNTGTSGFGGFGSNTSTTGTSPFGQTTPNNNTSGGLFGNKPATGGFGSAGFGSSGGGGGSFGGSQTNQQGQGTAIVPFEAVTEKDTQKPNGINSFQNISSMPQYSNYSFEVSLIFLNTPYLFVQSWKRSF